MMKVIYRIDGLRMDILEMSREEVGSFIKSLV